MVEGRENLLGRKPIVRVVIDLKSEWVEEERTGAFGQIEQRKHYYHLFCGFSFSTVWFPRWLCCPRVNQLTPASSAPEPNTTQQNKPPKKNKLRVFFTPNNSQILFGEQQLRHSNALGQKANWRGCRLVSLELWQLASSHWLLRHFSGATSVVEQTAVPQNGWVRMGSELG